MRSFLAAVQFLTVIPVRTLLEEGDFERAPLWFAPVGLLLGGFVVLTDLLWAGMGFPDPLRSLFSIGMLAALSGGLHLDGLADTADGFLSARPRERVLEIMRDSRIGTMGVLAVFFLLAVKVAALAELHGTMRWKAMLLAPVAGRASQVVAMNLQRYSRGGTGGLVSVFIRRGPTAPCICSCLFLSATGTALFDPGSGAAFLAGIGMAATGLNLWSRARIGGFTGDTLGATSELVETSVLLSACLV